MLNYLGLWWVKAAIVGALVAAVGWATYQAGFDRCFKTSSREVAALTKQVRDIETQRLQDVADLSERNRLLEQAWAADVAQIGKTLTEKLHHETAKRDAVIAGLRNKPDRLFIPVAKADCPGGGVAEPASGVDGAYRAQLSGEAAEFLVGLASEADACATKLTAAQELIRTYRKHNFGADLGQN